MRRVVIVGLIVSMLAAGAPTLTTAQEVANPPGTSPASTSPELSSTAPAIAAPNELTRFTSVATTAVRSFGIGGLRNLGEGEIVVDGVTGPVTRAYLYWHGPTNSDNAYANDRIRFGPPTRQVTGTPLGFSGDNCWAFDNSQGYRADVTARVPGNGRYQVSDLIKDDGDINANGASLVVFYRSSDQDELGDVFVFDGNDSSANNPFDPPGWRATLAGWGELDPTHEVSMTLHVADGQSFATGAVYADGQQIIPSNSFQGDTLPGGTGPTGNGNLWDIVEADVTDVATGGGFELTSPHVNDCVSLVVAVVSVRGGLLSVSPAEADLPPFGLHRVDIRLAPEIADQRVTIEVVDGPNAPRTILCEVDEPEWPHVPLSPCGRRPDGTMQLLLAYNGPGTDTVRASTDDPSGDGQLERTVTATWLDEVEYVALGDSYSSGDGVTPYLPGSNNTSVPASDPWYTVCDRSYQAYSAAVTIPPYRDKASVAPRSTPVFGAPPGSLRWANSAFDTGEYVFRACAGARTFNMHDDPATWPGNPDELRPMYTERLQQVSRLFPSTDLVTLTIGGNDVGFAPVLLACLKTDAPPNLSSCFDENVTYEDTGLTIAEYLDLLFAELPAKLDALYARVAERSPDATVVVAGYPTIFGSLAGSVLPCTYPWKTSTTTRFNRLAADLNHMIEAAADRVGFHFVDVQPSFAGHEYCGTDPDTWIQGLLPLDGALHPNASGHLIGYARAVNDHLANLVARGWPTSPTGLPVNPGALPDSTGSAAAAGASSTTPSPSVASPRPFDLVETSGTSARPDGCVGHLVSDTEVFVTAAGFAPDSSVEVRPQDGSPSRWVTADGFGVATYTDTVTVPPGQLYGVTLVGADDSGIARYAPFARVVSEEDLPCDTPAPTVTITSPTDGAHYEIDEIVAVDYRCDDTAVLCHGSKPDGSALDTRAPGSYQLEVTAIGEHGQTTVERVEFTVGSEVTEPPIETVEVELDSSFLAPPAVNQIPAGRTVPVRFRVARADGSYLTDPGGIGEPTVSNLSNDICGNSTEVTQPATTAGSSGLALVGDGWWRFNWQTQRSDAGTCRALRIPVAGGSEVTLWFELR
jgi:hypothetical protein